MASSDLFDAGHDPAGNREQRELRYNFQFDDLWAFYWYFNLKSPVTQRNRQLLKWYAPIATTLVGVAIVAFALQLSRDEMRIGLCSAGITFLLLAVYRRITWRRRLRHGAKTLAYNAHQRSIRKEVFGPRRVVLTPTTVTESSEWSVITYKLAAIHQIVDNEAHLFFLRTPAAGIVIPKSAFAGPDEYQAFLATAQAWHAAAVAADNANDGTQPPQFGGKPGR